MIIFFQEESAGICIFGSSCIPSVVPNFAKAYFLRYRIPDPRKNIPTVIRKVVGYFVSPMVHDVLVVHHAVGGMVHVPMVCCVAMIYHVVDMVHAAIIIIVHVSLPSAGVSVAADDISSATSPSSTAGTKADSPQEGTWLRVALECVGGKTWILPS